MCFKPLKYDCIETAEDDIYVAKVFRKFNKSGENIYAAPYRVWYFYGPMNSGTEFTCEHFGYFEPVANGFGDYQGFHSFAKTEDALDLLSWNAAEWREEQYTVFICVIPKGTRYMYGVDANGRTNFVSEKFRVAYEVGSFSETLKKIKS